MDTLIGLIIVALSVAPFFVVGYLTIEWAVPTEDVHAAQRKARREFLDSLPWAKGHEPIKTVPVADQKTVNLRGAK